MDLTLTKVLRSGSTPANRWEFGSQQRGVPVDRVEPGRIGRRLLTSLAAGIEGESHLLFAVRWLSPVQAQSRLAQRRNRSVTGPDRREAASDRTCTHPIIPLGMH